MNPIKRLALWMYNTRIGLYRSGRTKYVGWQDRKRSERASKRRAQGIIPERNAKLEIVKVYHGMHSNITKGQG